MKLYKYVSMESALRIVETSTIGFSRPEYFNDPFDRPFAIPLPTTNPVDGMFAEIGAQGKSYIWGRNTAILSMTRTPTSPLMWAHYGDSHRGAVIGIDASAAGFLDEASNLIPAHYGSVIYLRQRNSGPFQSGFREPVLVGATHHFVISHYEKWQRLFLSKPLDWAYEEEVRVVKCIRGIQGENCKNESGLFSVVEVKKGQELHTFHLPPNAILEVYAGIYAEERQIAKLQQIRPEMPIYRGEADLNAYAVRFEMSTNSNLKRAKV
jgi:hypothetical protein